jgi:glycine cleavage system H protein
MDIQNDFFYTKEHEWVSVDGNIAIVGISDYAQEALGDITFVELPSVDDELEQFGQIASVESVKAASDIFSPISGKIIEVNSDLEAKPGLINKSPYDKGWIAKIEVSDTEEVSNLMNAEEYENFLEAEG